MFGADEHVVRLGVRHVSVELDGAVREIVLMAKLTAVVGERPVEEVVDLANEANVIVERTPWYAERASSLSSRSIPRVPGETVQDLGSIQLLEEPPFGPVLHQISTAGGVGIDAPSQRSRTTTSSRRRRGPGRNLAPVRSLATGSRQPWT